MNNPLVSIIMVNYNGLKYLKRTIPLILKLKYENFEFIVVDNGSTDESIQYLKNYKNILLIRSPLDREKNFACNFATTFARGEYYLFLDNDIEIRSELLLKDLLNYYQNLDMVGCINLAYVDENKEKTKGYGNFFGIFFEKQIPKLEAKEIKKLDKAIIGYPSGIGIFISKKNWNLFGGYDNFLKFGGDDSDLGIKLWQLGFKNYLYSKTLQTHIGLPEREDNKKYLLKFKETTYAHLYTILKNYSFLRGLITIIFYSIFAFLKSIKQSILRKEFKLIFAYFQSLFLFILSIPVALRKRDEFRKKYVLIQNNFLKIKPKKG